MARAGIWRFWASPDGIVPAVRLVEFAPVVVLLVLCAALTIEAGASTRYLDDAAQALYAPARYVGKGLTDR